MEKTLKKFKIANWLMIVSILYCAAEMLYFLFAPANASVRATFFPAVYEGNAWRFASILSYAVIAMMLVQMIIGFTQVLKNRRGGIVCYVLFYIELIAMLVVQNLWYDGAWLRYIPIVIVLLISGFQGDWARTLCKEKQVVKEHEV